MPMTEQQIKRWLRLKKHQPMPYGNRDYDARCPECDNPYYWTRTLKSVFEHDSSVMVSCRRCGMLFWISRGTDGTVIVSRRRE